MSGSDNKKISPQPMLVCLALGLLFIAIVPGIGWLLGQFYETIVLCIGTALLVCAMFAYVSAVNSRLAALEKRLSDKDRARG